MPVDERIVELLSEWGARRAQGTEASVEELCREAPELTESVRGALAKRAATLRRDDGEATTASRHGPAASEGVTVNAAPGDTTDDGFVETAGDLADFNELGQLGPYRVDRLLGAGGMGVVFQATDDTLGRQVALKVLRPSLAHDERAQQRFLREARAAAALEHDHIVTIFQVGEERGIPYLAMPLLSGESLATRLNQRGRLPVAEVLRIGREIAEGLDTAHTHKVIHRDIKPANIWLEGDRGRVKILDFGLARATDEAHRLTHEDTVLGTPAYMAPEQATGSKDVDARLDLFSLGSVLYRMATGGIPFVADGAVQTLMTLVRRDPVSPREVVPEIPPALNDLILELLAKDPANRPPSARALVERIKAIEDSSQLNIPLIRLDPPDESKPGRGRRTRLARSTGWLVGGALALVLFGLGALILPRLLSLFYDKGRLTIESPLPYVLVIVKQSGLQVAVIDPDRQSTVALWPGAYDLELAGEHLGLRLESERVALQRGDRQVVRLLLRAEPLHSEPEVLGPQSVSAYDNDSPPGLIPHNAPLPGLGRWQVETRVPRSVVRALAWSPDRKRLACVAEHERMVRIYDTERLDMVGLLVGHTAPIVALSWSAAGHQLATASQDGSVRLWSASGMPGPILKSREGTPLCLAWSPNGGWLAVGGSDHLVRIWSRDGDPGAVLDTHGVNVTAVAWSPDGLHLVVGLANGQVHLRDLEGGHGAELEGDGHPVFSVSWSSDGRLVAAAGAHSGVRVWTADGTPAEELEDAPTGISCLAWCPTEPTLAAGCQDGTVRLWNADGQAGPLMGIGQGSGAALGASTATRGSVGSVAAQGLVGVTALAWSADGKHLVSAGQDGAVRQWSADGTPGPVLAAWLSPFRSVAWSPQSDRLVSDFPLDHSVKVWNTATAQGPELKGSEAAVNAVAWSPDGHWIAAGDGADAIRLWSAKGKPGPVIQAEAGNVTSIAWSPDSRKLAAGGFNNTVHLFPIDADRAPPAVLHGHTAHVLCVAWSPDGKRVVSGSNDCTIRLWDVAEQTSVVVAKLAQRIVALAWSPGDERFASASHDSLARIWRIGGTTPVILKGHAGPVLAVAWSNDGRRLATGGADGTLRTWSDDGTPGHVLEIGAGPVNTVAWSPDGRRLASASDDGTLRIWTIEGMRMERVVVPTAPGKLAVLDRSGRVIYSTTGAESNLLVYHVLPRGTVSLITFSEFQQRLQNRLRKGAGAG